MGEAIVDYVFVIATAVVTVAGSVRIIGALVSKKLRVRFAIRPVLVAAWVLMVVISIGMAVPSLTRHGGLGGAPQTQAPAGDRGQELHHNDGVVMSVTVAPPSQTDAGAFITLNITLRNNSGAERKFTVYPPYSGVEIYALDQGNDKTVIFPDFERIEHVGQLVLKAGASESFDVKIPSGRLNVRQKTFVAAMEGANYGPGIFSERFSIPGLK